MKKPSKRTLAAVFAAGLLAGCAGMQAEGPRATAQLAPTKGNNVTGSVSFAQRGAKVLVAATISGLKPNAEHGFHIHEKGDCSSGDGMSAGGHFNPHARSHGHFGDAGRHSGDMPNLKADAGGTARYQFETDLLTVSDGPAGVVGRAAVVHRDPDDYRSQPAGNSGPRIACGVVQRG